MLLDSSDLLLLRMIEQHRFVPLSALKRFAFSPDLTAAAHHLLFSRMATRFGKKGELLYFDALSQRTLAQRGIPVRRTRNYTLDDPTPRRMAAYAEIALTALRAGAGIAQATSLNLHHSPSIMTSLPLRNQKHRQMLNASQCAAFAHWGDTAYMMFYVTGASGGFHLAHELALFHALLPVFRLPPDMPLALVFAGVSYKAIVYELSKKEAESKNKTMSYSKAYREAPVPVHLLSCDEVGAKQLAMMKHDGYRRLVLNKLLGESGWMPAAEDWLDGYLNDRPLILGADMNVRCVESFVRLGLQMHDMVSVVVLEEQFPVYDKLLPKAGVKLLSFQAEQLGEFGALHTPVCEPIQTEAGAYIHV